PGPGPPRRRGAPRTTRRAPPPEPPPGLRLASRCRPPGGFACGQCARRRGLGTTSEGPGRAVWEDLDVTAQQQQTPQISDAAGGPRAATAFAEPAPSALLLLGQGSDLDSERGVECV